MNDELLVYTVQPHDTLASIAQRHGMAENELRDFHNENCQSAGLLWLSGITGIQKIVVPRHYKSPAEIAREDLQSLPPRKLTTNFYAAKYTAVESYESDPGNELKIEYTIDIDVREDKNNPQQNLIATLKCSDFLKKGSKPDDKMSEISIACSEAVAPLSFVVSAEGKLLEMYQFQLLLDTFQAKRKDLEDFFVGEIYTRYLDKYAESLSDQQYFEKQVSSTLLYQVLFFGLNSFHQVSAWQQDFYLVKNSFPLRCIFTRTVSHLDDQRVQTVFHGEVKEMVSLQSLLTGRRFNESGEEALTGLIELKYTTHTASKQLLAAEAGIALIHEDEIYRKQKIVLKTESS